AESGLDLVERRLRAVVRVAGKVRATVIQRLRNDGELKPLRGMRVLLVAEILPPTAADNSSIAHFVCEAEAGTHVVPIVRPVGGIERAQTNVIGERPRL